MFSILVRKAESGRCSYRVSHIRPERRGSDTTVWALDGTLPLDDNAPARYALAGALRHLADEIEAS